MAGGAVGGGGGLCGLPNGVRGAGGGGVSGARGGARRVGSVRRAGRVPAAMVWGALGMIGAACSMRPGVFGVLAIMALGCVMSGFGFFFLSYSANALGASGAVPVPLAAWAPPFAAVLFAVGLLLHLEDG